MAQPQEGVSGLSTVTKLQESFQAVNEALTETLVAHYIKCISKYQGEPEEIAKCYQ
jgi:hypothetical protein